MIQNTFYTILVYDELNNGQNSVINWDELNNGEIPIGKVLYRLLFNTLFILCFVDKIVSVVSDAKEPEEERMDGTDIVVLSGIDASVQPEVSPEKGMTIDSVLAFFPDCFVY